MKLLLKSPFLSLSVWVHTGTHPRRYSLSERRSIASNVKKLTRLSGASTRRSGKIPYKNDSIASAPTSGGVYRIHSNQEIIYIGATKNIRKRLNKHIKGSHNNELCKFMETGSVEVDWYRTLYYGWMECFELAEFEEKKGRLPLFNKIEGGISF